MKTSLFPYVHLSGRCEEALLFWAETFRGRVKAKIRMADVMPEVDPAHADWIIHSVFEGGGFEFMASDGMPTEQPPPPGGPVSLALGFEDRDEQARVFAALSKGGEVERDLHATFYGGRMGVITDPFGISWILNWSPPEAE